MNPAWEPWQEKYCYWPKRLSITVIIDDRPLRPYYKMSKWAWLKTIYVRRRIKTHFPKNNYEYEYAESLFDLIKLESQ